MCTYSIFTTQSTCTSDSINCTTNFATFISFNFNKYNSGIFQPVLSSFPCPGAFSSPLVFPPVFSTPYSFLTSSSSSSVYPPALSPPTQALYYNQPTFNYHFYSLSQEHAVFCLKHLHGTRIRTGYGCGNPIRTDLSYIPPPPHDVVVSYKERRYYRDLITHEMRLTPN